MEDEDFEPLKPNYYYYKGKKLLNNKFEISKYTNINLCVYNINNEVINPFQRFLFTNKIEENIDFPKFTTFKNFNSEELINYSKFFLFNLLNLSNFEKFNDLIIFDGCFHFNNNIYLFFDITNCNVILNDIYKNNVLLLLIDEIVNQKNFCNIKINENISNLFIKNEDLCFLIDENNNHYEIPIVSFLSNPKKNVNFTYIFGESPKDKLFGYYFYFTDFNNCFKNDDECIIRFALFMGKTKYIENLTNDDIDNSETKNTKLKDDNLNKSNNYLTIKITDYDGNWTKIYDSVYLGNIELENETKMLNTPLFVIKKYEQQKSLSYHYKSKNINEIM